MPNTKCPICGAVLPPTGPETNRSFPFCSPRCRDADLFRWFDEEYCVPVETNRVASQALEELERQGIDPPSEIDHN